MHLALMSHYNTIKMKKYNTLKFLSVIWILLTLVSCKKDLLDRKPLDALSTANPLATPNELKLYVNQFYNLFPVHPVNVGGTGIAFDDAGTDNMIFSSVNTRLSGQLALSNASSLGGYTTIRSLNYFLANYKNAKGDQTLINQYVGEARFFRALNYFNLVKGYGDVTWVNQVLPEDPEIMKVPRDPRTLVIDSVLKDLDVAISLLPTAANSASMRIHRDVASAYKSRIALYEGTWQRYHQQKADPFFTANITEDKIRGYFTQARDAASSVISSGRWSVYSTGKPLQDYSDLFITTDLSSNKEVMLWRKYNTGDNIGHSVSKYISSDGGDLGLTLSLVDDYLTINGTPFTGIERLNAQRKYAQELLPTVRDPRLSQTAGVPGQPMKPVNVLVPSYPPIDQTGFNRNTTGYPMHKFLEYNTAAATTDDFKSMAPGIAMRYAEVLLNYAEAVAELGGDQSLIASALKPLRDRAGMPQVDFAKEYNTSADYPFRNLSPVIQSVRRERRVEFACEGFRMDDIFRWAAADLLLVNKRQLGTLFTGSDLNDQNTTIGFYKGAIYYDTAPAGKSINLYLSGNPGDAVRYIDPHKNVLPTGSRFNTLRDYLLPLQQRMLQLTEGKWVQNPGW
ncbi:RagB/SusD family nutrient uptake outer membrane protein [Pedobacter ginsengiterrae]|uniref:RagB/SusD family nutrient uptake outer membrane protein n=2 Tax=Pedobacter ginsengiterrae TaxID=871696 RepID=A0ABP7NMR1_9SPHI